MVLPAILDPFAEGAAPAVMTRIALDWMIEGTSIGAECQKAFMRHCA